MDWTIDFHGEPADIQTGSTWAFLDQMFMFHHDIYIRGGNFTYDASGLLQSGEITSLKLYAPGDWVYDAAGYGTFVRFAQPQLVQSIDFASPVSASLLHDYLVQIDALKASAGGGAAGSLGELTSITPTQLVFTNWDGQRTIYNGTGFDGSWHGTVTSVSGSNLNISGISVPKYIVDGLFTYRPDWRFPLLALSGVGATMTNHDSADSNDEDLLSTAGNDTIIGEPDGTPDAPYDEVSFWYAGAPLTVDLAAGTATGHGTDTLVRIEEVNGSEFNDTLLGSAVSNMLYGAGGNDRVDGREGDDRLWGGAGNDTVIGGPGNDTIGGEAGNDSLQGGADNDNLQGGKGNDTIDGGDGIDIVRYDYESVLTNQVTMPGVAVSLAISGAQTIVAGEQDTLISIEGLIGSYKSDTLTGSIGDNVIAALHGNDSVLGGAGNDSIDGGPGNDTIDGGTGDDVIEGLDGNDLIYGGAGVDTAVFSGTRANYSVAQQGDGSYVVRDLRFDSTSTGTDTLRNVEKAQFSDSVLNLLPDPTPAPVTLPTLRLGTSNVSWQEGTPFNPGVGQLLTSISIDNPEGAPVSVGVAGADAGNFEIRLGGSGYQLFYVGPVLDYEARTSYVVDITLDATGVGAPGSVEGSADFNLIVRDVDETKLPTVSFAPSSITLPENGVFDPVVGLRVAGIVVDNPFAPISYRLTGLDAALFKIAPSGAGLNLDLFYRGPTLDFESRSSYDVTVAIDNGAIGAPGSIEASADFRLNVSDITEANQAPASITFAPGPILENAIAGAIAGIVSGTDPDAGDTLTYRLTDDAGGRFRLDGATIVTTGAPGLDYETATSHQIEITATDTGGLSLARSFTIQVGDVPDSPPPPTTISGTRGNDSIEGGAGLDHLIGGLGNDTYVLGAGDENDVIVELPGGGTDTVRIVAGYAAPTLVLADNVERAEVAAGGPALGITGNALANVITGSGGHDMLDGGAGNDTLTGGLGDDGYVVDSATDKVVEAANAGFDGILTSLNAYTLARATNVEGLVYTGTGNFDGTGNTLDNLLTGGDGRDTLTGGAGADTLQGGHGGDVYVVDGADIVREDIGPDDGAMDTVRSSASWSLATNLEKLELTGSAAINGNGNDLANTIAGNNGANILDGGDGDDTISGGGGNDRLIGGAGIDSLAGGLGNDTYVIDGADIVTELAGQGTDTIQTAQTSFDLAMLPDVENLTFTGLGDFIGLGNAGRNSIVGGEGNDSLDGAAGIDILVGGGGNDSYVVDNASDKIVEAADGGYDTVHSSVSFTLRDHVEELFLTGSALSGVGNALDNDITGTASANSLNGATGDDNLYGGGGADSLIGGLGNDVHIVGDLGFARIDGGSGDDMLVFGGALDLTKVANSAVTGIEFFYMDSAAPGGVASLTMAIDDVRALSTTASTMLQALVAATPGVVLSRPTDTIVIGGEVGDTLHLVTGAGGSWQAQATGLHPGNDFTVYDYWLKGAVQGSVVVNDDLTLII